MHPPEFTVQHPQCPVQPESGCVRAQVQQDDPGFANSWYRGSVRRYHPRENAYTVQLQVWLWRNLPFAAGWWLIGQGMTQCMPVQLLTEGGKQDTAKLPAQNLRPPLKDDSREVPLSQRQVGE